ncbi:type I methionyl aminopeptidase [Pendulispora albinea]|uniref:Methionine aminopeptidase n=1 Tax=Pendulispora albinea TaxID=2741071 RepID=A0ABZ2M6E7_9BACT
MIHLKSDAEIAKMRETGRIVHAVLDALEAACKPGISTWELDQIADRELSRAKARSAFRGYRPHGMPPYPAVLCASVNEVVVHGIPSKKVILRDGDVVGLDFACFKNDYCADAARTVAVGAASPAARQLLAATKACLERAIEASQPNGRLGDVGWAIEQCATSHGYAVVRQFVGHGIGRAMHEEPSVPNHGPPGRGVRLAPGMVIAIEPMVNEGTGNVRTLGDGWTVITKDHRRSAHFEHTVAITKDGPVVLTVA